MSWLSTLIHNNSGALVVAGNVLGAVNPVAGGILGLFNPKAKNTSTASTGLNIMPFQGGGRPPILVDSQSRKVGIPLPGGGVIGGQETTVRRYGPAQGTQVAVQQGTSLCTIRGYHLNKAKNRVTGQERGTYCVRNRHMNPGNGHAVKRAVRRLRAFHKLATRVERSLHLGRATSRGRARSSGRSCGCR